MEDSIKKGKQKGLVDSFIDFIFSNDERKWLILIFLLGVILRFFVSRNISLLGDEAVHGPHAIGFLHSGLISTFAHSPLWFYLQDIFFKIFGVTLFSSRFASFFYGSISIFLVYLISLKLFNKKSALISSFLMAVSFYLIRYTLMEMDLSAIFFLLAGVYLFLSSLEKDKFPYLAAVSLGLASLIKTLSLFFVPAFLIGFFLFDKKEGDRKKYFLKNLKKVILFGIIILIFFSPILLHNYFWFKDKQMVDTYFAQYFNIGQARQAYTGLLGYDSGILFHRFFEGVGSMSLHTFKMDPIIVLFGLFGLLLFYQKKEKKSHFWFLILFELSGFIFLILSNWLPTHYTTMVPLFCIFGGFFIFRFSEYITKMLQFNLIKVLFVLLSVILIFQIYLLMPHLTSSCATGQMRDYAIKEIDKNSLVVVDSRIYRGRIAWMFNDFHYLETSYFSEAMNLNQNMSGKDIATKVYFIECAVDDCGWGTIKDQPDLNNSLEDFFSQISSQLPVKKTVSAGGGYDEKTGDDYFKIYETTLNLKPPMLTLVDSTHDWFYYPVNYRPQEKIFDQYKVYGFLDNILYKSTWLIIILSILLALIFPFKIIIDTFREE